METGEKSPVEFSGTFSTYISMIGYLIGMADIWRFPFLVYRNGGGAFLIPFVITMVVCGVPLYFMEYSIAKFSGKGPYKIWDICPLFRGAGICIVATYMVYIAGSSVFRGFISIFLINCFKDPLPWTTCDNSWNTLSCRTNPFITTDNSSKHYQHPVIETLNRTHQGDIINTTEGTLYTLSDSNIARTGMTAAEEFWQYEALKLSSGLTDFAPIHWRIVVFMVVLRIVVLLCAFKSIKSIEKVMYVTTFVPLLVSGAVFIRSLTLPGAAAGLRRFYYPEFDKLAYPRVWIEAFLMSFYSLCFGWGGLLTLGSHAKFRENCIRNSIIVPVVDGIVSVITSSICFSVLGNMAHAYNVAIDDVLNSGLSLGVVSYVTALSAFSLPQLWNFLFLLSVLLVGLDSQIVPLEIAIQVIGEMFPGLFPKYHLHTLIGLSLGLLVMALPTCTGAGAYIFLWVDWYVGVWVGTIVSFLELLAVAWIYGIDRFCVDVSLMIGRQVPAFYRLTISFVSPIIVLMVFLTSIITYVPPSYGSYVYPSWARVLGWLAVASLMTPLVVKAILMLTKSTGNLRERTRKCMAFNKWGPKEQNVKAQFDRQHSLLRKRTVKELLHFTVYGCYSKNSDLNVAEKELDVLVAQQTVSET